MSREEGETLAFLECKLLRERDEALRNAMTSSASVTDEIADLLWSKDLISKHAKEDVKETQSSRKKAGILLNAVRLMLECRLDVHKREEAFYIVMEVFMRKDFTPLDQVANDIDTDWKARKGEPNGYESVPTLLHSGSRTDGTFSLIK